MKNNSGFTLTEMIIFMILNTIILGSVGGAIYSVQMALRKGQMTVALDTSITAGKIRIEKKIRASTSMSISGAAGSWQVVLTDPVGATATFSRSGTNLRMVTTAPASTVDFLTDVSSLTFVALPSITGVANRRLYAAFDREKIYNLKNSKKSRATIAFVVNLRNP